MQRVGMETLPIDVIRREINSTVDGVGVDLSGVAEGCAAAAAAGVGSFVHPGGGAAPARRPSSTGAPMAGDRPSLPF